MRKNKQTYTTYKQGMQTVDSQHSSDPPPLCISASSGIRLESSSRDRGLMIEDHPLSVPACEVQCGRGDRGR